MKSPRTVYIPHQVVVMVVPLGEGASVYSRIHVYYLSFPYTTSVYYRIPVYYIPVYAMLYANESPRTVYSYAMLYANESPQTVF